MLIIHWVLVQLTYFNTGIWALGIDLICRVLNSNRNNFYATVFLCNCSHFQKVSELPWFHVLGIEMSYEEGFQRYCITPLELSSSSFCSTFQSQAVRNGHPSKETVYEHRLSLLHRESTGGYITSQHLFCITAPDTEKECPTVIWTQTTLHS